MTPFNATRELRASDVKTKILLVPIINVKFFMCVYQWCGMASDISLVKPKYRLLTSFTNSVSNPVGIEFYGCFVCLCVCERVCLSHFHAKMAGQIWTEFGSGDTPMFSQGRGTI